MGTVPSAPAGRGFHLSGGGDWKAVMRAFGSLQSAETYGKMTYSMYQ